jgi:hypothetical protein
MTTKRLIPFFIASLLIYSVLDFGFHHMMLYVMGGIVGGAISEVFKTIGLKNVDIIPIVLIWIIFF